MSKALSVANVGMFYYTTTSRTHHIIQHFVLVLDFGSDVDGQL